MVQQCSAFRLAAGALCLVAGTAKVQRGQILLDPLGIFKLRIQAGDFFLLCFLRQGVGVFRGIQGGKAHAVQYVMELGCAFGIPLEAPLIGPQGKQEMHRIFLYLLGLYETADFGKLLIGKLTLMDLGKVYTSAVNSGVF